MLRNERFMEQVSELRTPCYLLDEEVFTERLAHTKRTTMADITYAIKACPLLTEIAAELADFLEICSPGELGICMRKRIPARKIVVAGVYKDREYLLDALEYGVRRFVIESEQQLCLLAACVRHFPGYTVHAALRLTIGNQFGMLREEAIQLFKTCTCDQIQIDGLHIYAGTQNRDVEKHRKYLAVLRELARELNQSGPGQIRRLIYGGGIPISNFSGKHEFDDRHSFEELVEMARPLEAEFHMEYELGRYLAAPSGCYITKVCERREREKIYIITDGGTHQLTYYNQQYGRRLPKILQIPSRSKAEKYVVCGVLCTGADIMLYEAQLGELREGDYLVFQNAGAYALTDGPQLFLSWKLPDVYLRRQSGEISCIRKAVDTGLWNGG